MTNKGGEFFVDKLYLIIPAYNEEANIVSVAKEWHNIIEEHGGKDSKLIIIDDGSTDKTYQLLFELKSMLMHMEVITKSNSGHGASLIYGYQYALKNNADYIFQTDSDGQTLTTDFLKFWENRKQYSVIIGNRKNRQDGLSRIFVTKILKVVLFLIFQLIIVDANTPYRLMKRETMERYINKIPKNNNLANILLTVSFENGKEKVRYIPISFRPRQGGINSINFNKIVRIGIRAFADFFKFKMVLNNNKI